MTSLTNPSYVGPGTWNVIHSLAIMAHTQQEQEAFILTMNKIAASFPCHLCREHTLQYIKTFPMEDYKNAYINNKEEKLGMFIWTWKFHNAVNHRIGKTIMDWETAYQLYSPHQSCSLECTKAK